jgi:hypothetical protein
MGWSTKTIVTDSLAFFGFLMIFIVPLIFSGAHRRVLNQRLYTVVDGQKLFEKLKYDLKIKGNLEGVDRIKLYQNEHYARTIFKGAMEYNERDFVWYFNERTAKTLIHSRILKTSWQIFGIWILFVVIMMAGTKLDLVWWIFEMSEMNSLSGIVPIWVLFIFFGFIHGLLKWREYRQVKKLVHDDIRRINLAKKDLVWKDFIVIFWSSIATELLGVLFLVINIFF